MKQYLLNFAVFLASVQLSNSQAGEYDPEAVPYSCLQNPDFNSAPGPFYYTNSGCGYWNTGGVTNWIRSHGTPNLVTMPNPTDNYVYLWGATKRGVFEGEGIFANFICQANVSYTAKIRVNVTDAGNVGYFRLYCANGLGEPPIYGCGSSLPILPGSQLHLITSNTERNAGWKEYEYTFTPASNFSYIWIYPYTNGTNQYTLLVDYVKVCRSECVNNLYYNTGQVPSGTSKAGNIYAGSSAGSGGIGTVTVNMTQTTTFIAGTEISLLPEFNAAVSTGTFQAVISPCYGVNFRPEKTDPDNIKTVFSEPASDSLPIMTQKKRNEISTQSKVSIFPNPITDELIIQTNNFEAGELTAVITDVSGRQVLWIPSINQSKAIQIRRAGILPGIYLIKITGKNGFKQVEKIIVRY
jgi:hypothetical protein